MSNKPEIRFNEYVDPWEQRKLGEHCDVYDGTHQTPSYKDSGIMFLSVENIKTLKSEKYISKEDFERDFSVFPEVGDVLMTRIGDIGTANVVESKEPKAYYVSLALLKKKALDPYFLKESISSKFVKKDLWQRTLHIAFPKKINKNEIAQVAIPYPTNEKEQAKIGSFFYNLDQLINLHRRKYDKLQNVKRSMLEKMFPKSDAQIPEIRFKEFEGDWNETFFGNAFRKLKNNSYSRDMLNYNSGRSKNIHYGDILVKFGFSIEIDNPIVPYINDNIDVSKFRGDNYLQTGDIVVADTAEDETVGKVVEIINNNNERVLSGQHTYPCRPIMTFTSGFLGILLNTGYFHGQLLKYMQGTKVTGINYDMLCKAIVAYPSEDEQKKIVDFFANLDGLISSQEKEITNLEHLKTALLSKMFI